MQFPLSAVERAMKVKEVIFRAISGEYTWLQAAEILGMSPRSLRRWRYRMERHGYSGLIDMRRGVPSPRRAPVAEIQRIVGLYRDTYRGYNARHFYLTVRREHGVTLSYTYVRQLLQGAGLMKKGRARGRHRSRRPRRPRFGEMLHLDGSRHCWLALVPEAKQTLIQVVDDATSRLLYAQLWPGETTRAVMTAMRDVVHQHGIPEAFYTDRAGWAFDTPKAGGKVSATNMTRVGEALARLGVEHIPSYSPQARGRSERMNRTLQDPGSSSPRRRLHHSPWDSASRGLRCRGACSPRPVSVDAPGCRRSDTDDPGRLQGRARDQHLQVLGQSTRRSSAGLPSPSAPSGRHCSFLVGIEALAKAVRSLVKTERTLHLSSTEARGVRGAGCPPEGRTTKSPGRRSNLRSQETTDNG